MGWSGFVYGLGLAKGLDESGIANNILLITTETCSKLMHPKNNVDPILSVIDVMITDVSSVALEFITLDKPVIYIDCPEFYEKTLKKTYSHFGNTTEGYVKNDPKANAWRLVGLVVYELNKLSEAIIRCLKNPYEFSKKRNDFAKLLSYNAGNAASIAADTLIESLKFNGFSYT